MQSVRGQEWWRRNPAASAVTINSVPATAHAAASDAERESNIPYYALLLFTFILLLAPQQIFPVLAPLRIAMLSIVLLVTAHAGSRLSRGASILFYPPGVIIALTLTAWAVITIPMSMWPGGSLALLTEQYFKTIIVFLLLASVINTRERLHGMCLALALMAIPLAITAIRNLLSGVTMVGGERIIGYDAPLAENPNDMALLMNLFLPLTIGLFLSARSRMRKIAFGALVALMVTAIFATFSRAGFLTLAITFCCYFFLLRNRPERYLAPILLVVVIVALPFLPGDYLGRIGTITDIDSDVTNSAQIRLRDYIAAVNLAIDNPLTGTGIGTNMLAMNEARGETWTLIHNVYLTLAVELGVPGVTLFIMLLIASIRSTQSMLLRTKGKAGLFDLYCLAEGLKVSLIAFSVAALFHPVAYHFYFYYIAGLAMALTQINVSTAPPQQSTAVRSRH
ncbi:MAG: O-antigen ligase family protein [Gammaproteobacteria bacterium]|nr:O-antigen ligase family protein [Gammaproteobacteria bacterium]MDP2346983.1 O-antigen ligase family protein [Gammaproteobacteria bacterium]